jgi:Secretion system C-terminal sorting domain
LDSEATEGQDIQIFSTDGRLVFSGKLQTNGSLAIPVQGWPTGLYIAKIKGVHTTITQNFVVQHP